MLELLEKFIDRKGVSAPQKREVKKNHSKKQEFSIKNMRNT